MSWHRAYYSVIQYCPDLGRLEAANVGIVLFCPELHFLDARVSSTNERITHFFGREGHDWKQINSFKSGLADRIRHSSNEIKDQLSFANFIDLQANLMQLSRPLPCKVSERPRDDLDRLFNEIVGVEKRRITKRGMRRELEQKFESAGISDKIYEDVSVTVPILQKTVELPFGFQNGRFNLLTPVKFEAQSPDAIIATACKYAVEGRSLYYNPDRRHGDLQLVVIGKFRKSDRDSHLAVKRVLHEHSVKLFRFDRVPELIDEIRRTAKPIQDE